jgi:hypothetical protein
VAAIVSTPASAAGAHEELHAELFFQLLELAAHTGLRGVQRLGHQIEVVALADSLAERAQLLTIHRAQPGPL